MHILCIFTMRKCYCESGHFIELHGIRINFIWHCKNSTNKNWQLHKLNTCITTWLDISLSLPVSRPLYLCVCGCAYFRSVLQAAHIKTQPFKLTIYHDYKWACWQDVLCLEWMVNVFVGFTRTTLISSTLPTHFLYVFAFSFLSVPLNLPVGHG